MDRDDAGLETGDERDSIEYLVEFDDGTQTHFSRFIPVEDVTTPMTNNTQTGPWVLALGTLAIGTAAMAQLLRRQRKRGEDAADDSLPQS